MEAQHEIEFSLEAPGANTATTLVFLAAFAVIMSWLVCYGVTNVLVSADLMAAWPAGTDPRPQWMLRTFFGLFGSFAFFGLVVRWISNRQLRRIDAMAD